ncbi:protein immune deficiency [Calliphora vicina]|uniref:protein immune deficiency n=1 Tax=Calliphora vicina TaxID=7373 RepID=UPI00325B1BE1
MFLIKKIFNSPSKNSKENKCAQGFLETDALPVEDTNSHLILDRNTSQQPDISNSISFPSEVNDVSFNSENNTMNLNNVNQQVVVQFSNINGLQIGSTYNINKNIYKPVNKYEQLVKSKNKEKHKFPKTITIDAMMKSQEEPDREILNEISTHLGSHYKDFMRELGFSEGQISAKTIDHNVYGLKEVIYQLLLDWLRNADGEGTVGYLVTKLWNSGHRECVYRLKSIWKSKVRTNDAVN